MIRPIGIDGLGVIFNGRREIASQEGLVPSFFELFGFFDVGHGAFDYRYGSFGNGYDGNGKQFNSMQCKHAIWYGAIDNRCACAAIFEDFFVWLGRYALPAISRREAFPPNKYCRVEVMSRVSCHFLPAIFFFPPNFLPRRSRHLIHHASDPSKFEVKVGQSLPSSSTMTMSS